jgi:ribosomal protein S27AE
MIKAIETTYKGYRFRSRLEARWAVFFDAIGIKWEYEPEGFELANGTRYLPDFRTSTADGRHKYYEVKPENISEDQKFDCFSKSHGVDAELLIGDPMHQFFENRTSQHKLMCPRCGEIHSTKSIVSVLSNGDINFYCESCDIQKSRPDDGGGILCRTYMHKGTLEVLANDWEFYLKRLRSFCVSARSARFEYGQCGATL